MLGVVTVSIEHWCVVELYWLGGTALGWGGLCRGSRGAGGDAMVVVGRWWFVVMVPGPGA